MVRHEQPISSNHQQLLCIRRSNTCDVSCCCPHRYHCQLLPRRLRVYCASAAFPRRSCCCSHRHLRHPFVTKKQVGRRPVRAPPPHAEPSTTASRNIQTAAQALLRPSMRTTKARDTAGLRLRLCTITYYPSSWQPSCRREQQ